MLAIDYDIKLAIFSFNLSPEFFFLIQDFFGFLSICIYLNPRAQKEVVMKYYNEKEYNEKSTSIPASLFC